ncbi:MAG: hypothetical protein ACLPY5_05885 [Candidatus Bathyarchaeia archaeon]
MKRSILACAQITPTYVRIAYSRLKILSVAHAITSPHVTETIDAERRRTRTARAHLRKPDVVVVHD